MASPLITTAGLQALADAQGGLLLAFTRVDLGTSNYDPTPDAKGLKAKVESQAVAQVSEDGPGQVVIAVEFEKLGDSGSPYDVGEIGLWASVSKPDGSSPKDYFFGLISKSGEILTKRLKDEKLIFSVRVQVGSAPPSVAVSPPQSGISLSLAPQLVGVARGLVAQTTSLFDVRQRLFRQGLDLADIKAIIDSLGHFTLVSVDKISGTATAPWKKDFTHARSSGRPLRIAFSGFGTLNLTGQDIISPYADFSLSLSGKVVASSRYGLNLGVSINGLSLPIDTLSFTVPGLPGGQLALGISISCPNGITFNSENSGTIIVQE